MLSSPPAPSFFTPPPPLSEREPLLGDYLGFLNMRNGPIEGNGAFAIRETRMADLAVEDPNASLHVDDATFNRNYERFDGTGLDENTLALLAFVKVNAGEAYGVEMTRKAREHLHRGDGAYAQVERAVLREEDYHTRLLLGVVDHFANIDVTGAWSPHWSLKLLIGGLTSVPGGLFHPLLLGSELSGVFQFNWMLQRVGTLFPDDPQVRESMEERLIEILIDEVGHVAFNRIVTHPAGVRVARTIAGVVLSGAPQMTPELEALGLDTQARRALSGFDYTDLPEEVRRRAFFV
ncbi:MAG: hypothetical protein AAGA48_31450 [Myxococcota bacterium]